MKRHIYEADLSHRAVAVYLYLQDRADRNGICFPAIGTIAKELHISRSTVKRAIGDLEKNGFLNKEQRWRENGGRSSLLFHLSCGCTKGAPDLLGEPWHGSR